MDLTLVLMQQLIRVTYFAWAVNDKAHPPSNQTEAEKARLLKEDPTLLEFLSYNFNFLGMLCPSTDFFDFLEWINQRGNYASTPMNRSEHIRVGLSCLGVIVFYVLCSTFLYSTSDLLTDNIRNSVFCFKARMSFGDLSSIT